MEFPSKESHTISAIRNRPGKYKDSAVITYTDRKSMYRQNLKKIKRFLSTLPEFRKESECIEIAKLLENVKFLEQFRNRDELIKLCRYMELESFEPKSTIFKQGDLGEKFYIILEGSVTVNINIPATELIPEQRKEVAKLDTGEGFGELALLYDNVRSATIVANEITDLIILSRSVFRKYVKDLKHSSLQKINEFLNNSVISLENINPVFKEKLSTKCLMKTYPSQTVIAKQKESASYVVFIKTGIVKVLRSVKFKIDPYTREVINDPKGPTSEEIRQMQYTEYPMEIDELGPGDSFGDYEVLQGTEMKNSYVTALPSQLVQLSQYDYKLAMDENTQIEMRRRLKPYPEDQDIRGSYFSNQKWKKYKENVTNLYRYEHSSLVNMQHERNMAYFIPKINVSDMNRSIDEQAEIALRIMNAKDSIDNEEFPDEEMNDNGGDTAVKRAARAKQRLKHSVLGSGRLGNSVSLPEIRKGESPPVRQRNQQGSVHFQHHNPNQKSQDKSGWTVKTIVNKILNEPQSDRRYLDYFIQTKILNIKHSG